MVQPASESDSDKPGATAFTWLDLAGEEEDSFLFVIEGVSREDIEDFETTMYRCMWEREHMKDSKDINQAELEVYK